MTEGLNHCNGKMELFIRILEIAFQSAEQQLSTLEDLYTQRAFSDYTIQIHSMKGQLLNMGAIRLGEAARELELASREGRYDVIASQKEIFAGNYRKLMADIGQVIGQ